ncbi:hypothetical protein MKW98_000307, partial [Papaver atlanticum]
DLTTEWVLRNLSKKAVALRRVNFSAPPNYDNYDISKDASITTWNCVGDIFPDETIEWSQQHVTLAPGSEIILLLFFFLLLRCFEHEVAFVVEPLDVWVVKLPEYKVNFIE